MFMRYLLPVGLALFAIPFVGFGLWLATLRATPATFAPPVISKAETEVMLSALKPPKRARPLIAVVGINDATETTDYLMPVGILRRADIADVTTLSSGSGSVKLYPALTIEADATIAAFDALHPKGADYVIVPAMSRDDDPVVTVWLRKQAEGGAIIIAICAGAKVVASAGLLDGGRATTHWYYLGELLKRHPSIRYVADRRIVLDRGIATTTGITASMPMMLTLIEAIAGRGKAEAVARALGQGGWSAGHDSSSFRLTRPFVATVLGNRIAFWNRDRFGVALEPGMDEVSLALVADAWSRTYRSSVTTFAASPTGVTTRDGVRVLPDRVVASWAGERLMPDKPPAEALDSALQEMAARHGQGTADVVAMQLEYPQQGKGR